MFPMYQVVILVLLLGALLFYLIWRYDIFDKIGDAIIGKRRSKKKDSDDKDRK